MKKRKTFKIILSIILIVGVLIYIIPSIIIQIIKQNTEITLSERRIPIYDIIDLYNVLQEVQNYEITIENNKTVYDTKYSFNVNISEFSENDNYEIEIILNNNKFIENQKMQANNKYEIDLIEGNNTIKLNVYKNSLLDKTSEFTIYMIKPYKKQFLDELSTKGVVVHYRDGTMEDYSISKNLLQALGAKYIRAEFLQWSIEKNEKYNYASYDKWVKDLINTTDIKILAVLDGIPSSIYGKDMKINSDEEIDRYVKFFKNIKQQYPQIEYYEILNEVNLYSSTYKGAYFTEEEMQWYSKLINTLEKEVKDDKPIKIVTAGTTTPTEDEDDRITSEKFYTYFYNTEGTNICNNFAFHPYAINNIQRLKNKVDNHKKLYNSFGGFNYLDITEYGSTMLYGTEETQAIDLVKQTATLEEDGDLIILYNLWTTGDSGTYEQFGILNKDYTPKSSYYAMKNYYENTNGSEYIGEVNIDDNIEAHVYNKDGKPKIILWANNNKTISIDYKNFIAKDIYGNDIENTNGKLNITNSPIYLDNVSTSYFYQAISNTALEKYAEFEDKFATEIAQVSGLQEKINELKQYMQKISSANKETDPMARQKMKEHFDLGNLVLEAYKNGNLSMEYVNLSSMLDMINDIGNSYEDLVTVSSTTRNPSLQETKTWIDTVELDLKNNSDLEMLYINKILEFSKDLYEESEYINGLKEENDIKTGLIVSKDLHAKYLAEWANIFTNIYIEEYINNNPVSLSYSETKLTNKDVIATLNTSTNDIKITNNNGKNTYTFSKNGTFTFEYIRRGRNFTITATVNNIDKEAPEITGVKDGIIYSEAVIPNITDKNLDNIQIKYNFGNIEYKAGKELSGEGTYIIKATDQVGNIVEVTFYIIKPKTESYIVKDNNIINIQHDTNISAFKNKLGVKENYKILSKNKQKQNGDLICTGDILELGNGEKYTLVVGGDLNGDGKITAYDLSHVRNYLLKAVEYDEVENLAANMNMDAKGVTAIDYSAMREFILGIE